MVQQVRPRQTLVSVLLKQTLEKVCEVGAHGVRVHDFIIDNHVDQSPNFGCEERGLARVELVQDAPQGPKALVFFLSPFKKLSSCIPHDANQTQ